MSASIQAFFRDEKEYLAERCHRLAAEFRQQFPLHVKSAQWHELSGIPGGRPGQAVAEMLVAFNDGIIDPEESDDFTAALRERLLERGGRLGLEPVDSRGAPVHVLAPYGFEMILYSQSPGRRTEVEELLRQVCAEAGCARPGFLEEHPAPDAPGEFYRLGLIFQDYRQEDARIRILLGAYFRLLRLALVRGLRVMDLSGAVPEE